MLPLSNDAGDADSPYLQQQLHKPQQREPEKPAQLLLDLSPAGPLPRAASSAGEKFAGSICCSYNSENSCRN